MKAWLVNAGRAVLSLTLIFSGFVKAIDPLGTQYKISDYLTVVRLADVLPEWTVLAAAIALAATEFALGIFLFLAIRRRLASRMALVLMAVMTLVAVWVYAADPVKDCGCFGDVIHLTNGQTLLKNIVLLACAVVVAKWPVKMVRFISETNQWIAVNYTILFVLGLSAYSLYDLPMFDFRPYHVGQNLWQAMQIPEGEPWPEYETTFMLEKDGRQQQFTLENYPDTTWHFIDSKTTLVSPGYQPEIHDFSIETQQGDDITEDVLTRKGYTFLLVAPNVADADDSNFGDIDAIYEYARKWNYPFYCLTAATPRQIARWVDLTGAEYPFCATDFTTLRTIIRSNPGLLLLKDGTVIAKWSHNALPANKLQDKPLGEQPLGEQQVNGVSSRIVKIVLWFLLPLFMLTLADRLWAWSRIFHSNKINYNNNEKENRSRQLENEHEPARGRCPGKGNQRVTES
jgi:hypothetical protein